QDVLTVLHRRRSRVRVQGYEAMSSVTLFQLLFRYHSFASKYNFDLTSKTAMLKSFLEWSFKSSLPVIIEIMSCTYQSLVAMSFQSRHRDEFQSRFFSICS